MHHMHHIKQILIISEKKISGQTEDQEMSPVLLIIIIFLLVTVLILYWRNLASSSCCCCIFNSSVIRELAQSEKVNREKLQKLVQQVKQVYTKLPPQTQPLDIQRTSEPFSDRLLREKSQQYTEPVVFVNQQNQSLLAYHGQGQPGHIKLWDNVEKLVSVRCSDKNSQTGFSYKSITYKQYLDFLSQQAEYDKGRCRLFNASASMNILGSHETKELRRHGILVDIFESGDGHRTGIHNEINSTVNIQIKGSKQWVLVDPKWSDLLIPLPLGKTNNISGAYSTHLLHLKTNKIPSYKIVLNPGDILFVPSWFWHECVSIGESYSYSIRCAHKDTWFHPVFAPGFSNIFAGYVLPVFHTLIYKFFTPNVGKNIEIMKAKYGQQRLDEFILQILSSTVK